MSRLWAVFLALACGQAGLPEDSAFGVVDPDDFPDASTVELIPTFGYANGQRVEYYRTGTVDVPLNPDGEPSGARANQMVWFYRAKTNEPLFELESDPDRPSAWRLTPESQAPIVDDLPGHENYSPYWEIVAASVPDAYAPNQIKSYSSLRDAVREGLISLEYRGLALNCPIVDTEVELSPGASVRARAIPRIALWVKRLRTYCFLFEQPAELLCPSADTSCPTAGYPMPRALVGAGTPGAIAAADSEIARPILSIPLMPLYYPRTHQKFSSGTELDIFVPDSILTDTLPGEDTYSPLSRSLFFTVPPDFQPGTYTSLDDIDPALAVPAEGDETFFNIPIRGTVDPCMTDADCDDGLVPPLSCNSEIGYCDVPPRGYGEPCGPGIARCSHTVTDLFPLGLACTGLRVQTTRSCYMRCDWEANDENAAEDQDSRCGSIPKMTCVRTLRVVEPSAGVCMAECNALVGQPESKTANASCERTPDDKEWDASLDAILYDGTETAPFDLNDNPTTGAQGHYQPDDSEPDERVDLFEGQTCVTSVRDLCAWPDSRVDEYDQQISK